MRLARAKRQPRSGPGRDSFESPGLDPLERVADGDAERAARETSEDSVLHGNHLAAPVEDGPPLPPCVVGASNTTSVPVTSPMWPWVAEGRIRPDALEEEARFHPLPEHAVGGRVVPPGLRHVAVGERPRLSTQKAVAEELLPQDGPRSYGNARSASPPRGSDRAIRIREMAVPIERFLLKPSRKTLLRTRNVAELLRKPCWPERTTRLQFLRQLRSTLSTHLL